jgi:hypothetical protein
MVMAPSRLLKAEGTGAVGQRGFETLFRVWARALGMTAAAWEAAETGISAPEAEVVGVRPLISELVLT